MNEITKLEEQILLSVWRLGDNSYGISVYQNIVKVTGRKMAVGGIYFPLERLVKKDYLKAHKGEPTHVRGGQSKRYYQLTPEGLKMLQRSKEIQTAFWKGLPDFSSAGEKAD